MSRSLRSLPLKRPICPSCSIVFRPLIATSPSQRRHNSTSDNTADVSSSSTTKSDDSMFTEIDFNAPRKFKEVIERYKITTRTTKTGMVLERVEQRSLGEEEDMAMEELPAGPELPLSEQLKLQMRRVLYPVTLITAYENPEDPETWHGMTISSFNTVAMEPVPLISFNVKFPSTTGQIILEKELFTVNVLCQHINAAKISAMFVHRPPSSISHDQEKEDGEGGLERINLASGPYGMKESPLLPNPKKEPKFRPRKGPFQGLPVYRTPYGIRLIPNVLLAALGCQLRKVVNVGDHKLVIAEVMDVYGAVGDRPQERRRFHLQGHRLEREMAQTYRNGKYVRHRTENIFDVSSVYAGKKLLMDDMTLDYKNMTRRTSDRIEDI